ncbi:MAG TPA: DUF2723 domain-containing protein [Candidatus Glassbacteria bacterium]|nr:DUF2723 domain-containing protein [Candidatus Glassbacteria bacterium]
MYQREHWLVGAITALFVFAVYFITMAPSVTFWDAGEFIAASYTLGIPHPPGTPLFVIVGRVLSTLPLPISIAARLNFLSVLCGAAGALLIYLVAVKLIEKWVEEPKLWTNRLLIHGGAFACAVIPSFMRTSWSNSTEFEVYAVSTTTMVFCAWLMTYIGASDDRRRMQRTILLVIYIVSLSIANHLLVLLVAPAVIVYALLHDRRDWQYWSSIVGLFLGVYLIVMKGVDLGAVFSRMHEAYSSQEGLLLLFYRHLAAFFEILFGLGGYIGSPAALFFGVLITVACVVWSWKQKSLGFFGASLGLFLLGFSIHLYLLIRAGFDPPINEGNPGNLRAFWAVIGREQYGSAYGLLPRQVWSMITGKNAVAGLHDLWDNAVYYFKYNWPFYLKYFGWQYGNYLLSSLFFAVGLVGAVKHYLTDKKSFYFWLVVFLITGPILNTYMNFKLGYDQFMDKFPDMGLHEVRERDYFFMVSFVFYGVWSGLGLAAIANWFRRSFRTDAPQPLMNRPVFASICTLILLAALVPVFANYEDSDRSGNYIPSNYARNIMNSMDPDGIIFTNGDNDTFPLWYIQEVEGVRKDCRVVNLSLLNTNWYIKEMRDREPKVPISYSNEQIDQMTPMRLPKEMNFKFGEVELKLPANAVLYVKDIVLLDILRSNRWRRPIYFTTTVPASNRTELSPYLTMEGAVYRINPRRGAELAREDSNSVPIPGVPDVHIDVQRTHNLLYDKYTYETFFRKSSGGEEANLRLSSHFAAPFAWLGHAYQVRGQLDKAIEANLWARRFFEDPHQWDFAVATLYTMNGQYSEAGEMMDSFLQFSDNSVPQTLYRQLAQETMRRGDNFEAAKFVERALALAPDDRASYAALFLVYNSAGNRELAAQSVQRYLSRHPEDSLAAGELQNYIAGGNFDINRVFGSGR